MTVPSTEPARPAEGTIERYAEHMRPRITTRRHLIENQHDVLALIWIEITAENTLLTGDELRERIRNVLAARNLVADEVRESGR
jgi:hypothetical protein